MFEGRYDFVWITVLGYDCTYNTWVRSYFQPSLASHCCVLRVMLPTFDGQCDVQLLAWRF